MRIAFVLLCCAFSPLGYGQTVSFTQSVYPVLEKAGCAACHNSNGVASATRLHFPEADAPRDRVEAFGKSLVALVDRANPRESLLLKKPTLRIAHTGGERIKPGSSEEAILISWIGELSRLNGSALAEALRYGGQKFSDSVTSPAPVLRRLTHSQYNHTVADLLGDQSAPANQFPQDDFINGFTDQYDSQSFSPLLEEAYSTAAVQLAASAFRMGDRHRLIPCRPSAECRAVFIRTIGKRAFRRPLDAPEQARYLALFNRETDFVKGAQLVLEAMLQSPNFLFRMESSDRAAWRPYATASRLSYAIWDTMPDDSLVAAAERGDLSTREGMAKVARGMLQDPRAHQALDEYVGQWLRFDRVLNTTRDRRRYSQFNRETAVAMTEEAKLFIGDLVWNNRNFMDAFSAGYGFANAELASIYGVPAPAKEFDKVTFPPESERAGLLGQALFLTLTSKPEDTSVTARGLFVREQFLCQHIPPPPPGVNTNLPEFTEAHPQTNRDRMGEHTTNPTCAACHHLIDPIGWGFEKFDAVGQRREKYRLTFANFGHGGGGRRGGGKSVDLDLNTRGTVAGIATSDFASPRELGTVLVATPQCQECMVKQYFRYTAGRAEAPADAPVIARALEDFRKSGFHFQEMIVSLLCSREFPENERSNRVAGNH
jgi:hypothetical protein